MTQPLSAKEDGVGDSTIVFLHGFGGCLGLWEPIARRFADRNRTLCYDLPGHAGSLGWPDAGPAKIAVRAILADLETREIGKVHLVGHSMGGAIATLMALARPDAIVSLTLLAPGGFGEAINGRLLQRYARAVDEDEIGACLAAMSGPEAALSRHAVKTLAAIRALPGQTEKLIEIALAISGDDRQGVIPRAMLASLAMPVSLVWGTLDPVLPHGQAEGHPASFSVTSVEGAGHMLPEEATDLVVEIIRRTIA